MRDRLGGGSTTRICTWATTWAWETREKWRASIAESRSGTLCARDDSDFAGKPEDAEPFAERFGRKRLPTRHPAVTLKTSGATLRPPLDRRSVDHSRQLMAKQ